MNAVQIRDRIDFYNDLVRSARFPFSSYEKAVNDAIATHVDNLIGEEATKDNLQKTQVARDKLYTLYKSSTPTIVPGTAVTTRLGTFTQDTFVFPNDYYALISLRVTIDGYSTYARPTDYNEMNVLMEDIYRQPSNKKPYYNEFATGVTVIRGNGGTFSSINLRYIGTPNTYVLGHESQVISQGGLLTNGQSYIALEDGTVQNAITYKSGAQFTAVGTSLTAGQVILASNTTTSNLPDREHDIIAKMAAEYMMGAVSDYNKALFVEKKVADG